MRRKLVQSTLMILIVVLSTGLAGGQVRRIEGRGIGQFVGTGNHEPIYIYGDCDFTPANGVMGGSGTSADPFIIEGWRIDGPRADYGIYIDHTCAHFVIRDCVIERSQIAGVYLNSVRNGMLEDVDVTLSDTGVYLLNSDGNVVRECSISDCLIGLEMAAFSDGNTVAGNSFVDNGLQAVDPMGGNWWCAQGRGNYWSDFVGRDCNGDGIFDSPNYRYGDPCPLVEPPPEPSAVISCPQQPAVAPQPVETPPAEEPAETPPAEEVAEPTEISAPEPEVQTPSEVTGAEEIQTASETVEPTAEQTTSETVTELEGGVQSPSVTPAAEATQTPSDTAQPSDVQTSSETSDEGTAVPAPAVDVQTPPAQPEPVVDESEPEGTEAEPSEGVQTPSETTS